GLLAIGVFALCMDRADNPRFGVGYAVAIGLSVGVLTLASWLVIVATRQLTTLRAARARWPYVVRQGLAHLPRPRHPTPPARPANQTRPVTTALGFGVCLLAALYLAESNLLRSVTQLTRQAQGRPNLVFIDIQRDQVKGVELAVRAQGHPIVQDVPIVPMRIV